MVGLNVGFIVLRNILHVMVSVVLMSPPLYISTLLLFNIPLLIILRFTT